jgi:hypothetical protein
MPPVRWGEGQNPPIHRRKGRITPFVLTQVGLINPPCYRRYCTNGALVATRS